ncbi:MAG: hypothetical protein PHQ86_07360 [Dehalococcoidales bacterium]|nr:hypothetical protein [Dehalococcoidales bacterium]
MEKGTDQVVENIPHGSKFVISATNGTVNVPPYWGFSAVGVVEVGVVVGVEVGVVVGVEVGVVVGVEVGVEVGVVVGVAVEHEVTSNTNPIILHNNA